MPHNHATDFILSRFNKITGVPLNAQVLDRFAYSNNNPIVYTDPTGYDTWDGNTTFGWYETTDGIITLFYFGQIMTFDTNKLTGAMRDKLNDFKTAVRDYWAAVNQFWWDLGGAVLAGSLTLVSYAALPVGCTIAAVATASASCLANLLVIFVSGGIAGFEGLRAGSDLKAMYNARMAGLRAWNDLEALFEQEGLIPIR
jgi:hypothetical protein